MVSYKCCCFSAISVQGRIQGVLTTEGPLLQRTSSSDLKTTATNPTHRNYLEACGKKCCYYYWLNSKVKFSSNFDIFMYFVILTHFHAFFLTDFYEIECQICILYVALCRNKAIFLFKLWVHLEFQEFLSNLFCWNMKGVAPMNVYVLEMHSAFAQDVFGDYFWNLIGI